MGRLDQTLELLAQPGTILEVAKILFGETQGYHELLAIEEAGALVEYLYQRGLLGIDNLEEIENADIQTDIRVDSRTAVRYVRT